MAIQRTTMRRVLAAIVAAASFTVALPASATPTSPVVILVPGYGNEAMRMPDSPLGQELTRAGYLVLPANVANMTGDLTEAAQAIVTQTRDLQAAGYTNISLVGVSVGGLVTRTALTLTHAQGEHPFRSAITLGSPLQGVDLEALGPGWECHGHLACEQMKPTSPFMQNLPPLPVGKNTTPLTSIWTQDDLVVPPLSSLLPGVTPVHLQSACPGIVGTWTGHEHLTSSPAFSALVLQVLSGKPETANPLDCRVSAFSAAVGLS